MAQVPLTEQYNAFREMTVEQLKDYIKDGSHRILLTRLAQDVLLEKLRDERRRARKRN